MSRGSFALCFAVSLCVAPAFADEAPLSFEERHADKSSIILFVDKDIKVNADRSYVTRSSARIKILKEDAKALGEFPINYDRVSERIIDQKVFTLTADGRKLAPVKSQDMAVYDGDAMYSNAMVRVLSMPALELGASLDVSFTIATKGLAMKDAYWTVESMRASTPVKEYRYTITFPKKLDLRYREFGLTKKPEITEKNGWVSYRWVLQDLYDAGQDEEYVPPPSPDDPMEAFEFSSVKSWDDIALWYWGLISKNTVISPEITAAARKAVGDAELVRDKTRAILEYIQDNFRYVSMSFGANAFEPHSTKEIFANKYGDCKDLSLLARAMLEAVGVKSSLALFAQEDDINDPSYDLPIPSLFNHVLLWVDDPFGGDFYADPLLKGYDIGQYPRSYQLAYTFVIDGGKGVFRRLAEFDKERLGEYHSKVVDIADDGSGVFEISQVWSLDDSIDMRDKWRSMNDEQKDLFHERMAFSMAQGGEMISKDIDGLDLRYGRLRSSIKFRRPDAFPLDDGLIVIDLDNLDREEAFEKKERREDFFFPFNGVMGTEVIYRFPSGFEYLYIPSDLELKGPAMEFSRSFKRTPLGVSVKEQVRIKRVLVKKEAIEGLKAFRAELSRKTRQRIVLKKVK